MAHKRREIFLSLHVESEFHIKFREVGPYGFDGFSSINLPGLEFFGYKPFHCGKYCCFSDKKQHNKDVGVNTPKLVPFTNKIIPHL